MGRTSLDRGHTLTDDRLTGVLLLGAYRDAEVDAAHPLTTALARLTHLLAEMLRLSPDQADALSLADAIGTRIAGNPVESRTAAQLFVAAAATVGVVNRLSANPLSGSSYG